MRFFRPLTPIHAITFDLDDTLYDNAPVIVQAESALQAYLAQHYPQTAQLSPLQWQQLRQQQQPALASDMAALRRCMLSSALQHEVADAQACAAAVEDCFNLFYAARSDFQVAAKQHQLLSALAAKVPLVAITNGNVDTRKIGIHDYFSLVLHANVQQPMKPHPHMFRRACEHLRLTPCKVLHVGDHLIKDVRGALDCGMQAAWYACNRSMDLNHEPVAVLPHLLLDDLDELLSVV